MPRQRYAIPGCEAASACDLVTDLGINVLWQPSLGLELGDKIRRILEKCMSGEVQLDTFVVEGSAINGPDGTGGRRLRDRRARCAGILACLFHCIGRSRPDLGGWVSGRGRVSDGLAYPCPNTADEALGQ